MLNDLRYSLRMLLKTPGLSVLVVVSLSLGIVANTTIFSFVNAILLRPPPVKAPGELWQVWRQRAGSGSALELMQGLSYPSYVHYRDLSRSFESLAAFDPEPPFVSWDREGVGQSIQCQFVTGNFFEVCGIGMQLGRAIVPGEDRQAGADPIAVVSHSFWTDSLGSDPQVVGRALMINGVSLMVIGVAPADFRGLLAGVSPDLWVPFMMASTVMHDPEWHTRTGTFSHFGVGRLKAGVSAQQAQAELTLLTRQLETIDPENHKGVTVSVVPASMIPTPLRSTVAGFSAVMMGAVLMVLLIACANAANLLLARTVSRRKEIAVRVSLGASRLRLMRQLLAESVTLAMLAGAAGLVLTAWCTPLLLMLAPPTLPLRLEIGLDWRVVAFTAAISLLMGLVFGFAPAWKATRVQVSSVLKEESTSAIASRWRFSGALVVGQVAICLMLLICGALCLRSLINAQNVRIGMDVRERVMAEVNLKEVGYSDEQRERFNVEYIQRVSAMPGVESAAMADFLPLGDRSLGIRFAIENHGPPRGENAFTIQTFNVGPGFFRTMGTRLLKGREFTDTDREGAVLVVVINQAMAERFWPGQDPIGRRLTRSGFSDEVYQIIGVVETGRYRTLSEATRPVVFRCRLQERGPRSTFVAHIRGDANQMLSAMRGIAREIDPHLSLSRLATMEQHLSLVLFPARATGLLFGVLGTMALLLAVSGLFGVVAYSVSRRTREIGIRMAMGAQRGDVHRMVLRQGMTLVVVGILVGLIGAFAGTRLLSGLLVEISSIDPISFISVPVVLAAVALAACSLPAWRAARVDPMVALRSE